MKIEQLHKEWLDYKTHRIKSSSLSTYENAYVLYIQPFFTGLDIMQGVNNKLMNNFIAHLIQEKKVGRKTAQQCKNVLGNILKYGNIEHNIPLFNYSIEYPKDKGKGCNIKFFNKQEIKKVFDEMERNPSSQLLGLVIGLTTGLRIGELCGLKFSDCDFQEKTLTVNRTIERIQTFQGKTQINLSGLEILSISDKSALVANSPKTETSQRKCPLVSLPLKWIKLYSKTNPSSRFIVGLSEMPIEPRTYRNWYYRALEKLGLPKLNPHCMRHTFATQMLHNGVDIATTASILGHSSPAITLDIYSHTNEEEKNKKVNSVYGKFLRNTF